MSSVKETISAGNYKEFFERGDFFRLLATTGPVDVEFYFQGCETVEIVGIEAGYAEYFRGAEFAQFDRVRIYSATTQDVQFVTRYGSDVRYDRGASSVTGTIALDAATLAALEQINIRPEAQSGFYSSSSALAANTPEAIFLPGENVNGAILLSAWFAVRAGSAAMDDVSLLTKTAAPVTTIDGSILAISSIKSEIAGAVSGGFEMQIPQYIEAGKGLYFISGSALGAGAKRGTRFKLL